MADTPRLNEKMERRRKEADLHAASRAQRRTRKRRLKPSVMPVLSGSSLVQAVITKEILTRPPSAANPTTRRAEAPEAKLKPQENRFIRGGFQADHSSVCTGHIFLLQKLKNNVCIPHSNCGMILVVTLDGPLYPGRCMNVCNVRRKPHGEIIRSLEKQQMRDDRIDFGTVIQSACS